MTRQDTLWERFLSPIVRSFINEEELQRYYKSVDGNKRAQLFKAQIFQFPITTAAKTFTELKAAI